jgi:salicylate biosynthesis isochorismate synthase
VSLVGEGVEGVLTSTSRPIERFDAIALYAAAVEADLEAALWLRPSEGFSLVGIGRAWAVEPAGPGRFREAAAALGELAARAPGLRPGNVRGLGPLLVGGLGFTGRIPAAGGEWARFGAASLVLPELIALGTVGGWWLTTCGAESATGSERAEDGRRWQGLLSRAGAMFAAGTGDIAGAGDIAGTVLRIAREIPTAERWRHVVALMTGAVGRGRIDKVVMARRLDVTAGARLDVPGALRRLAATAPESTVFAFRRGGSTFMGATPERLVRTDGRAYRTAAIAGSIRRGHTPEEDAALAAELLASDKEREEHAVVVRAIRQQLAPVSETLDVAPGPGILALRNIQHLATEIAGTVRSNDGLLALAELLHPTPAVGGEPRDVALAMIDEHEGFERGWYAGPIGWLSPDGDGELMVALRCGLVRGDGASLFAGCGIVADSDPEREWEESTIKMRTLAAALGRLEEGQ